MKRYRTPHVNLADLPIQAGRFPGAIAQRLAENSGDVATSMKVASSGVGYLTWAPNHTQPHGQPHQLEYHTLHEEIFVLQGSIVFDNWYEMTAPAYMNHPPFWVHPTNFWAGPDGLVMLLRMSTDAIVQFEDIPAGWDGTEYFAAGKPTRSEGVTKLQLDDLPWQPLSQFGQPTGIEAKYVYFDADDDWTTWLMRLPPGWRGQGDAQSLSGSDELYLIEGDLTLDRGEGPVTLTSGSYFCDPDRYANGGSADFSESGATLIRWTRGGHLTVPLMRRVGGDPTAGT